MLLQLGQVLSDDTQWYLGRLQLKGPTVKSLTWHSDDVDRLLVLLNAVSEFVPEQQALTYEEEALT